MLYFNKTTAKPEQCGFYSTQQGTQLGTQAKDSERIRYVEWSYGKCHVAGEQSKLTHNVSLLTHTVSLLTHTVSF